MEKAHSPVKIQEYGICYWSTPAKKTSYLWNGFLAGFQIPYKGVKCHSLAENLKSRKGFEHIESVKIILEVAARRKASPFPYFLMPELCIFPLNVLYGISAYPSLALPLRFISKIMMLFPSCAQ